MDDIRKDATKEFMDVMDELENSEKFERMIKDNHILFKIENKSYRVRKPNFAEQTDIEKYRRTKYLELMNDDSMKFRKQWVEIYKQKGIDINKMEQQMIVFEDEKEKLLLRLAKTTNKEDIEKLKDEIIKVKSDQININTEKTDLLSYSIEDNLTMAANAYYTYMVLEEEDVLGELDSKGNTKWLKVFKDYESFRQCKNSNLINQAFYCINYLIYSFPF